MLKKLLSPPLNLLLLFIFLVFSFGALTIYTKANSSLDNIKQACINNQCFNVEVAQTPAERALGLMYRQELAENSGMLFIFAENALHNFWMKNTFIPLDIIWISADNKIIYLNKNTLPCKTEQCPQIKPNAEARYVLEINADLTDEFNIKIGDQVNFK